MVADELRGGKCFLISNFCLQIIIITLSFVNAGFVFYLFFFFVAGVDPCTWCHIIIDGDDSQCMVFTIMASFRGV